MVLEKFKEYRSFVGTIECDENDSGGSSDNKKYRGRLLDIPGKFTYQADTIEELCDEFHKSVDEYYRIISNFSGGPLFGEK